MFILKILPILTVVSFFAFVPLRAAWANEHGEAQAEHGEAGGHESKEEGHGEAKEGGHEGGGKEEGKSSQSPWLEIENKITELNSKIKSKEANILHLIEEKNHLPNNSPELKHVVKEIVTEHKEMRSLAEEYEKQVTLLKYRFPERNAKTNRSYDRIEIKSVEEMEHAMGIDGKLNRNLKRMRSQFKSEEKDGAVAAEPAPSKPASKKPKSEPSIEEADAIIIHK
jgi:hypothetical protein